MGMYIICLFCIITRNQIRNYQWEYIITSSRGATFLELPGKTNKIITYRTESKIKKKIKTSFNITRDTSLIVKDKRSIY